MFPEAQLHPPLDIAEMVRLATIPATQLLAETRSALLLVDVQNRFIFGASESNPAPTARVIEPIGKLLATARAKEVPRFYVTASHPPGAASAPWMRRLNDMGSDVKSRAKPESHEHAEWGGAVPAVIAPQQSEVHLLKCRFSAFYETGLDVVLRGAGIETVVLGGVASYGCIIATYIDACTRGFFPLLCTEAIDGANPTQHKAAMDFMSPNCRIGVDDVRRIWSGEA
ncbi:MAG TPA: isochorismatase family cysteine hydrolase [Xanthobacteraceae bacterium]|jgi:nicotinamidase-related amidase